MKDILKRIAQYPAVKRIAAAADQHKLVAALILAITAALTLVAISISMYYATGFYRYDLSRPGYEKERTEIAKPEAQKDYDTSGQVSKATIDAFLQEFDARQKDFKAYGDYRDLSLGDDDLLLITAPTE